MHVLCVVVKYYFAVGSLGKGGDMKKIVVFSALGLAMHAGYAGQGQMTITNSLDGHLRITSLVQAKINGASKWVATNEQPRIIAPGESYTTSGDSLRNVVYQMNIILSAVGARSPYQPNVRTISGRLYARDIKQKYNGHVKVFLSDTKDSLAFRS